VEPFLIVKKIGSIEPDLPLEEWIERSRKLPTGVYNTKEKLLFRSKNTSEAIQWAVDHHYKIKVKGGE